MSETNQNSNVRLVVSSREKFEYLYRPLDPVVTQIQSLESLVGQTVNICASVGKNYGTTLCNGKKGNKISRTKLRLFDKTGQLTLIM